VQTYETSEPFNGDPRRAMEFVAIALTTAGFQIDRRNDATIEATAPRTSVWRRGAVDAFMPKVKGLEVCVTRGRITARANLAEVSWSVTAVGMATWVGMLGFLHVMVIRHGKESPSFSVYSLTVTLLLIYAAVVLQPRINWRRGSRAVRWFVRNVVVAQG
jgi:hypothetical protein